MCAVSSAGRSFFALGEKRSSHRRIDVRASAIWVGVGCRDGYAVCEWSCVHDEVACSDDAVSVCLRMGKNICEREVH